MKKNIFSSVLLHLISLSLVVLLALPLNLAQAKSKTRPIGNTAPIFQLNSQGHMGEIAAVQFTNDNKYLVSAGNDKIVRVWNLETGLTTRIIRGYIGEGAEGQIYSIALSPDNKWLAVAGFMGNERRTRRRKDLLKIGAIRIYHFATGELAFTLKGHDDAVNKVTFSPDNKYLASVGGTSMILWNIKTRKRVRKVSGHKDWVYSVTFTPDSKRIITSSNDTNMVLWRTRNKKRIARLTRHKGKMAGMAVSSLTGLIASASDDKTIRLWKGSTGRYVKILTKLPTKPGDIAFSPDGKWLVSSTYDITRTDYSLTVWNPETGQKHVSYNGHDFQAPIFAISTDNKWVASAGGSNNEIHIWNLQTGKVRQVLKSMGSAIWAVRFSQDGTKIAFGKTKVKANSATDNPLEFQMQLPTATRNLGLPKPIGDKTVFSVGALHKHQKWSLRRRKSKRSDGRYNILNIYNGNKRKNRITLGADSGYAHHAYSFSPNGKVIVSGGMGGVLRAYTRKGRRIGRFLGHRDDIRSLAISPDGKLLLTGSSDQTIKLWNIKTQKLIFSMFHSTSNEWIIWTRQGYYTSSPFGDRFVGWQINRGVSREPRHIQGSQLKQKFYRPDIVEKAIRLSSSKKAIKEARNTAFVLKDLVHRKPPEFEILSPYQKQGFANREIVISLKLKANTDPIKYFNISTNGIQMITRSVRGLQVITNTQKSDLVRHFKVNLLPGENLVKIRAVNAIGNTLKHLKITYHPRTKTVYKKKRGTLYLIAIGVDQYPGIPKTCNAPDGSCDLRYAGKDAYEFYKVMKQAAGALHDKVKGHLLVNQNVAPQNVKIIPPVKDNIEDVLDTLRDATENDTILLFLAGHGVNDTETNTYYFLPTDAKKRAGGRFRTSSIVHWSMLQNAMQNSKGRRLMFIDTCHSGNAYNARLVKDAADSNIVVFSATDANTLSQELETLKNGVFTHSIIKAFNNAYLLRDKKIKILELTNFVSEEVETLTNNSQQPQISLAGTKNFVIGKRAR